MQAGRYESGLDNSPMYDGEFFEVVLGVDLLDFGCRVGFANVRRPFGHDYPAFYKGQVAVLDHLHLGLVRGPHPNAGRHADAKVVGGEGHEDGREPVK